jgi:hypothetical protein
MRTPLIVLIAILAALASCTVDQKYSQTQLAALQTREFDANLDRTFDAVIGSLFDAGYTITHSDKRGGFVAAFRSGGGWTGTGSGSVQIKIEPAAAGRTSVRVGTSEAGQQRVDKERIDELFTLIERRLLTAPKGATP